MAPRCVAAHSSLPRHPQGGFLRARCRGIWKQRGHPKAALSGTGFKRGDGGVLRDQAERNQLKRTSKRPEWAKRYVEVMKVCEPAYEHQTRFHLAREFLDRELEEWGKSEEWKNIKASVTQSSLKFIIHQTTGFIVDKDSPENWEMQRFAEAIIHRYYLKLGPLKAFSNPEFIKSIENASGGSEKRFNQILHYISRETPVNLRGESDMFLNNIFWFQHIKTLGVPPLCFFSDAALAKWLSLNSPEDARNWRRRYGLLPASFSLVESWSHGNLFDYFDDFLKLAAEKR
jgi:hypothetical protein